MRGSVWRPGPLISPSHTNSPGSSFALPRLSLYTAVHTSIWRPQDFALLTPVPRGYDLLILIGELFQHLLLFLLLSRLWPPLRRPTYSWYLSITTSPVPAITVSLFISCCGKLLWQSAVINHLAQALGIEASDPIALFFIELGKKNNIQFISPLLFHVSCHPPRPTTTTTTTLRRTRSVLKVILCKPSFLLSGLRKANIWRV